MDGNEAAYNFFLRWLNLYKHGMNITDVRKKIFETGLNLTTKQYRDIMQNDFNGKLSLNGRLCAISAKSIGAGLYRVTVDKKHESILSK